MLNPVKLYKADQKVARKAVTAGPMGKPGQGSSGSTCYRHGCVDWTVHRLAPELHDRGKPGGVRQRTIAKATMMHAGRGIHGEDNLPGHQVAYMKKHTSKHLRETSPRWGEGRAPGLKPKRPVARSKNVDVSPKTMAAAKAGVAGTAIGGAGTAVHNRRSSHQGVDNK